MTDRYYYFASKDRRLWYSDNRLIEEGVTHTVEPPLNLCNHGLHASRRAIDALLYAPGPTICIVELSGEILHADDKSCATERTYLDVFDGGDLLSKFARRCALDVINLRDAPYLVREYLETGDADLRADARTAAWDSDWDSDLGSDLLAAWYAAWETVWSGAWYAAKAAARDEKMGEYNTLLEQMISDKLKEDRND